MKELKDIRELHPTNIKELSRVKTYYPFEYHGRKLRCVPVKENSKTPCRYCRWEKDRNTSLICPMIKACSAAYRDDRTSVKFISDELSSLNMDEESQRMAMEADRICMKAKNPI